MPRPASGAVLVRRRREARVYALRFRAYGRRRYLTLGTSEDGWTQQRADAELQNVLADVRRGIWQPPTPVQVPEVAADPTFHEFASQWLDGMRLDLAEATQDRYAWGLTNHLLPFFADHRLSQITIAEVDRYRTAKVRQGRLNATSINMTISLLAQILDVAIEYHPDLLRGNVARGRRRRLKTIRPERTFLETDQLTDLLDAAAELDNDETLSEHMGRRPMLATMALAGLRIGELVALRWRDIDLASARLFVRDAKTPAGIREVDIAATLRDDLAAHRARTPYPDPDHPVFATTAGGEHNRQNIRQRVLNPALQLADQHRQERGLTPMPTGITPHSLRRTYISLLLQGGENPRVVMEQVGHTDPELTLRIYAQVMRRRERPSGERIDDLLAGSQTTGLTARVQA